MSLLMLCICSTFDKVSSLSIKQDEKRWTNHLKICASDWPVMQDLPEEKNIYDAFKVMEFVRHA
jgi:hypothetical protein